jgi:hypothetical protein
LSPQHDELRQSFRRLDVVRISRTDPDQLSPRRFAPTFQHDKADYARLRILALFIQGLFAKNPNFVDECMPTTVSVNKLARDNRRLAIRDESYDPDA